MGGLYFYPFLENEPYNIEVALPSELKDHDLFDAFLKSLPLIVRQVNQIDKLNRKLKVARLELQLTHICSADKDYSLENGLASLREFFKNDSCLYIQSQRIN